MPEYIKYILHGTNILFGEESVKIVRNKSLDAKKEIRLAKTIRKTSMLKRGANRIRKVAEEALG